MLHFSIFMFHVDINKSHVYMILQVCQYTIDRVNIEIKTQSWKHYVQVANIMTCIMTRLIPFCPIRNPASLYRHCPADPTVQVPKSVLHFADPIWQDVGSSISTCLSEVNDKWTQSLHSTILADSFFFREGDKLGSFICYLFGILFLLKNVSLKWTPRDKGLKV